MQKTMFDTPILRTILRWMSIFILKIFGWTLVGEKPDDPKYVMIAAPHTSNWDMPIMLFLAFAFKVKVYWIGKDALFKNPFGAIMKFLGGVPVDRSKSNNVVEGTIQVINESMEIVVIVPPEGTRSKVRYWKTGFYYIALGAKVPISTGFIDYACKTGGLGPIFHPTGDIDADMELIKDFYAGITGKYAEKNSETEVSPDRAGKKCS